MNLVDVLILLFLVLSACLGFKRGFTRELVSFIGFFAVVIIAFYLKNPISQFLYENLPFFKFGGLFKGVTALNILIYEVIALLLAISILSIALKLLVFATKVFEKLLTMTIILGIPSKILGAVVGLIEGFVWIFIILYITSLPAFNLSLVAKSGYKDKILNHTPILSSISKDSIKMFDDFKGLQEKYKVEKNAMQFNYDTIKIFLQYNIVDVKSVDKLVSKGKLQIDNLEPLLACYRETTKNNSSCDSIR